MNLNAIRKIARSGFFVNIRDEKQLTLLIKQKLKLQYSRPFIFNYIYLGSLYYIFKDPEYLKAMDSSDFVLLDGFLIGWILKIIYKKNIEVVNLDYLNLVIEICRQEKQKIFLLGSNKITLKRAIERVKIKYPGIEAAGFHGYSRQDGSVIKKINSFRADLLIVALGLQKQEKWIYDHTKKLKTVKVITSGGIYVDVLGGERTFFPKLLKKYNLRWAYRIVKEPKRLWKRYIFGLGVLLLTISYFMFDKLFLSSKDTRK